MKFVTCLHDSHFFQCAFPFVVVVVHVPCNACRFKCLIDYPIVCAQIYKRRCFRNFCEKRSQKVTLSSGRTHKIKPSNCISLLSNCPLPFLHIPNRFGREVHVKHISSKWNCLVRRNPFHHSCLSNTICGEDLAKVTISSKCHPLLIGQKNLSWIVGLTSCILKPNNLHIASDAETYLASMYYYISSRLSKTVLVRSWPLYTYLNKYFTAVIDEHTQKHE